MVALAARGMRGPRVGDQVVWGKRERKLVRGRERREGERKGGRERDTGARRRQPPAWPYRPDKTPLSLPRSPFPSIPPHAHLEEEAIELGREVVDVDERPVSEVARPRIACRGRVHGVLDPGTVRLAAGRPGHARAARGAVVAEPAVIALAEAVEAVTVAVALVGAERLLGLVAAAPAQRVGLAVARHGGGARGAPSLGAKQLVVGEAPKRHGRPGLRMLRGLAARRERAAAPHRRRAGQAPNARGDVPIRVRGVAVALSHVFVAVLPAPRVPGPHRPVRSRRVRLEGHARRGALRARGLRGVVGGREGGESGPDPCMRMLPA